MSAPTATLTASAPVGALVGAPARGREAELVRRCIAGDHRAMREVYEGHRRRVFSLAARIAGAQEAEEVTQEVFVKAFGALARFRGDAQLSTWLYRLTVNASLSHVGRARSAQLVGETVLRDLPAAEAAEGDPGVRGRLERAIAALAPGHRAVLVLHDIEGLGHEEAAEILGCSVGTTKSQLHKARARMRELLGEALATERGTR